ncbi:MAG: hypothetical protein AABX51_06885 [Nanoarchaeota archaeon]
MIKKDACVDIPTKFWLEWLGASELGKIKLLKKTMLVKELSACMSNKFKDSKLTKRFASDYAARLVNDYLQDLETVIRGKKDNI